MTNTKGSKELIDKLWYFELKLNMNQNFLNNNLNNYRNANKKIWQKLQQNRLKISDFFIHVFRFINELFFIRYIIYSIPVRFDQKFLCNFNSYLVASKIVANIMVQRSV